MGDTEFQKLLDFIIYLHRRDLEAEGIDLDEARRQIGDLSLLVSQRDHGLQTVRNNHGGSGQSDSS